MFDKLYPHPDPMLPDGTAVESELEKFNRPHRGLKQLPEIVVFTDMHYKGSEKRTNLNCYTLGQNLNDQVLSVIVVRGTWRLYRDPNYQGDYWDLPVGYYPKIGEASCVVSSFQCIDWD